MTRGSAGVKAKSRSILKIINAILNPLINDSQIVVTLRECSIHHLVKHFFKSAGLIDLKEYATLKYLAEQMKKLLKEASRTASRYGRATDAKRRFVNSILLAIAKTPPRDDQDEPDMSSKKNQSQVYS